LQTLYFEGNELAKGFLLKHGFHVLERRDFEVADVPIHNYAVEKCLRSVTSSHTKSKGGHFLTAFLFQLSLITRRAVVTTRSI
jgi:hypothetical protein